MKNLIHLQHPQFEVILSLNEVSYAHRIDGVLWVYFTGDTKPLQLRDGMTDVVWKILKDSSLTVYVDTAAGETKNAETPTSEGFSE